MARKRAGTSSTHQEPRPDVVKELAHLKFERKNKVQPRLPQTHTIQRRPLNHAPIASPYASASVQKVVYVSRNTPIMSAVKRVKKLLARVEQRAMQDVDLTNDRNGMRKLAEAGNKIAKDGEEVLVKASGRAMEQALRIAEWFRQKEDEMSCRVEVRTSSVQAVDDIVEIEDEPMAPQEEVKETELELTQLDESTGLQSSGLEGNSEKGPTDDGKENRVPSDDGEEQREKPKRRRKRKHATYDADDVPEARVRWIKTVEVAISSKG